MEGPAPEDVWSMRHKTPLTINKTFRLFYIYAYVCAQYSKVVKCNFLYKLVFSTTIV